MKKEKRLNLILTVIQQNQFNKKQQIVDYMARHFGVYYSLTTISRDLQELEIYKIPVENKKYIYKKINQTNQLSAKKQLEIFSDEIIEFITLNNYVLIKNISWLCSKYKLLHRSITNERNIRNYWR